MRARQYNISVIMVSRLKILENCSLGLLGKYEKYYCLVLKFLIISFLITPGCLGLSIFEIIESLMVARLRNSFFFVDLASSRLFRL